MAKNQNFEFEDFDFDDFGAEGNDGGFNGVEPKDDRKPVTKIMGGFVEGASSFVTDPSNQVRFIKQALPPGYSQAIGSVEKSISNAKSLYDTALREAAPAIKEAKKITKVLLPSVKGVLPKSLADKMETWIEDKGSSSSDFNPEENEITMSLGSIFAAYQEANKEQTEKAAAEQAARDYALAKQTGDSIKQLVGIHNYTGRLVAYQDQITSKYQQKSLELQYRQFFTAKKSLEVLTQHLELSKTSYDILVKNTALPELVKVQNSEIAKDMMKRKFLGKVTEPLSQWYSGIGQRVMMKARKDITTFFKDLGTNLGDFNNVISEANETLQEVGGGSLGDLGLELAGQSAGGAVAGKLSDRAANFLRKKFGDNTTLKAFGQFAERVHLEAPERAKKFLEERAGDGTMFGWLADYVQEAAGKYQKSTVLQENTSKDLEQKMYFDFQTRQTIVEVIPKWLSKIHRTLEQHRNQDHTKGYNPDKQLEEMWDWEESRIVTRDYAKKKLSDRLMEKTDAQRTNKDARKVMEFFDKGETDDVTGVTTYGLSADVRRQLFKHLIQKAERGELADLEIMVSPAALANPKLIGLTTVKEVEELQKFIKTESKFGYDKRFDNENAWNQEGTRVKSSYSKSLGLSGPFKESKQSQLLELTRRQVNVQRNMKDKMGQMLEEIGKSTEATQLLQELGFAKREGDTYHYNLDKFLEQIYNYDDADTPRFRASGGTLTEGDNPFKSLFQGFKGGGKPQKPRRIKGQVRGPGTTTSDSIPAYVSDKEFIVRAESVGLPGVLPLLQFINSLGNKPDMAPHQLVGAGADSSTASIRMEQMITNNWQTTNDTLKEVLTTMQEMGTRPIFTVNLPDLPNFDLSTIDFNKIKLSLGEAGVLKLYNSGKNLLAAGGKAGIDFAKWTGRNAWELGKGAFGVGKGLLAAGGGAIKSLWSEVEGFYVSGKNRLLLSLKDLEIEDYIDVNTQKVIKKLSDITGEVRDTTGRVIISAEDYAKGIYYGKGRQVITWLSEARDTAWKGIKGVWNLAAIVPNTIKSSYTFMVDVLEAPDDVYVEGDDPWEPRLRAHQFKQNYYRIKATGEPVKRVSQLVEPIVDLKGNVIIDEDDLKRGLVDFNHQPIKGLRQRLRDFGVNSFEKALNIGKKIATTTQDIMFNLFGNIKNFFTGSSWGISLFTSTQTVVTRLEQIWHLLNNRLKGKKQNTPTDFGKHAKFTITANAEMSKETKEQIKQTAQQVKDGVKEAAKAANSSGGQAAKAATEAAKQLADKAKNSQPVQKAKTWWDEALDNYDRRKQEWQDNESYQNWLERNSSNNPTRQEDLDEEAYNQWLERSSAENPVREDRAISNKPSAMDNFKRLLNLEGKAQSIEQSKAMVLGYLKSKTLYQTIFENENLSESAKEAMMKRLEKARELLPNVPSLPADIKEKLQRLSKLADEERRPQSIKRYLDYVEEVAKKYGNKPNGGFGSWLSSLFGNKETEQQAPAPRIRSTDMDDLVQAQQSANPQPSPAGGDLLQARTWLDDAKESLARRKQEWADNNAYQDYLERTSSMNPAREDEEPTSNNTTTTQGQNSFDRFKQLLNSEARSQFLEDSKANVLGYLKSKSLYTTLFENENLTETARASIMERIEKVKTSLPNLETLPQEVKAKLQKLSTLVDEEGRPQSVKRYLDYAEEVAKKYGNKAKDKSKGFGGWFKGLFSSDKEETPQQPTQPRTARSSDMEALVEAQQAANPQPSPAGGDLLSAIQENHANGRELGIFKQLFSMFRRKPKPARNSGTDEVYDFDTSPPEELSYLADTNFPQEPRMNKLMRMLKGGASNLASDRTRIADAFRNSSGLTNIGKGTFADNLRGIRDFDFRYLYRTNESMQEILAEEKRIRDEKLASKNAMKQQQLEMKQLKNAEKERAKSEKIAAKNLQKEWDVKYFEKYTELQTGNITKEMFNFWMQRNPSPEAEKRRLAEELSQEKALEKKRLLDIKNEPKRLQKEWDTKYFEVYTQWQTGEISKDAHDAWLQRNPSPADIKKRAIQDAKDAKSAEKQRVKDENKQAKDKFMQDQKHWDMVHGQVYAQFARGLMTKAEYEAWLEKNPSPKELRKQKLGKLSFKQRMGKIIKGDYTDRDGDGDRDGSAEDQRQQREEKKKNSLWEQFMTGYKEGKDKKITINKEGLMGGLKTLLGGVMTLLGPVGRVLMTLKNVLVGGMSIIAKGVGMAVRVWNTMKGLPTIIGRWAGAAKGMATRAIASPMTKAVVRGGSRVLGAVIGGPVRAAIMTTLAVADYATGGAISGTIGDGWNAIYDYFNAKSSVIAKYRMAQYGYDVDDESHMKKLITLEQLVTKNTSINSAGQAVFTSGLTAEEAMKIFNVDTKNEDQVNNWVEWFVKRFKPVYLAHATMMYVLTKKIDVPKADDIVPAKQKVEYLNGVHFTGDGNPYTITASPFPGEDEVEIYNGWVSDSVDSVYENVLRWAKDNAANSDLEAKRKREEQLKKDGKSAVPEKPDNSLWGRTKAKASEMTDNVKWAFNHFSKEYNVAGTNLSLNEIGQYWGAKAFDAAQSAKQSWNQTKSDFKAWNGTTTPASGGWGKRPEGFDKMIADAAAKYGVPEHILRTMAFIESKGVADAVANKGSPAHEAVGIFQFTRAAAQDTGLIGPNGEDYRWDPQRNIEAGAFTIRKNMQTIRNKYGIEPTPALLYMMHQQGPGGFNAIMKALSDPSNPMNHPSKIVLKTGSGANAKSYTLQQSIDANAGKGASIQDFVKYWENRYDTESAKANATYSAGTNTTAATTKSPGSTPIPSKTPANANTMVKPVLANANTPSQPQGVAPKVVAAPMVTPVSYTPPNGSAAPISAASYNTPAINTNPPEDFSLYKGEQKYIELGKKAYRLESGVDMRLDPAFAQRIYAAFGEYYDKTKKLVTVTSCFRDYAKQAELYRAFLKRNRREPLVAAPGRSKHEKGLAIDISSAQGNEMERMGLLRKNGIIRPLVNHPRYPEPWHLEMASKEPTKPEESDTMNYISPISQPEVTPLTTSGTPAPVENKTASATNVEPVLPQTPEVVATKPAVYSAPVITNPADKMVVQSRDDESQKKAMVEAQKAAKAVEGAKGIDGAVEILRQQHRIQEQMRDSLVDLGQTALRLEQVLLAMANNVGSQQTPQQPNVVRPNIKTATDTRSAPVSVSRQT